MLLRLFWLTFSLKLQVLIRSIHAKAFLWWRRCSFLRPRPSASYHFTNPTTFIILFSPFLRINYCLNLLKWLSMSRLPLPRSSETIQEISMWVFVLAWKLIPRRIQFQILYYHWGATLSIGLFGEEVHIRILFWMKTTEVNRLLSGRKFLELGWYLGWSLGFLIL